MTPQRTARLFYLTLMMIISDRKKKVESPFKNLLNIARTEARPRGCGLDSQTDGRPLASSSPSCADTM